MANENTILTALGLDISQFEKGSSRAVSSTRPLLGAIEAIDSELRKIPILGGIYSATFGRIGEGFAETRLQARAFGRTMQTDVSGSLEGTLQQIDEINGQLKELKEGSFSRTITDAISNTVKQGSRVKDVGLALLGIGPNNEGAIKTAVTVTVKSAASQAAQTLFSFLPGSKQISSGANTVSAIIGTAKAVLGIETEQVNRVKQEEALQAKKTQDVENLIGLLKQESAARSSIVSGSELESEQAKSYLDMRQKILNVIEEAQKIGGPDSAGWNAEIQKSVGEQANLYVEIYNKQVAASKARNADKLEELKTAAKIADLQANSNEREIASAEIKLAEIKLQNAIVTGVKEEIAAAQARLAIAHSRQELVQHQYELNIAQLHIETQLIAAQVTGQTRLVRQLEIQAHYQIQISEELRRGNTERAKELAQQAKLAQLQEAIRQYELGGHGRAAERAGERHARRTARVVQSRLNERGLDQRVGNQTDGGLIGGGLRSGGLTAGSLARPIARPQTPPTIPLNEVQTFMKGVLDALTK